MANRDEYFHPPLIIDEHFDALINRIDVITEKLLQDAIQNDRNCSTDKIDKLNELRAKQIKEISQIKNLNLKSLMHFNEERLAMEWSDLNSDNSIDYNQKIDKIKEKIISVDCVLLEEKKIINGLNLLILDSFYNEENLEILK